MVAGFLPLSPLLVAERGKGFNCAGQVILPQVAVLRPVREEQADNDDDGDGCWRIHEQGDERVHATSFPQNTRYRHTWPYRVNIGTLRPTNYR